VAMPPGVTGADVRRDAEARIFPWRRGRGGRGTVAPSGVKQGGASQKLGGEVVSVRRGEGSKGEAQGHRPPAGARGVLMFETSRRYRRPSSDETDATSIAKYVAQAEGR
jgi:hypothetical protein